MALRRVFIESIQGNVASVGGECAHHLHRVARLKPGELVEISDSERLFLAAVTNSSGHKVEFEIRQRVDVSRPPLQVVAGLAIFRFPRLEWVIEKATELGVATIVPLDAARSDRGLAQAAAKRRDRWLKIAREAALQSRRLAPPEVEPPIHFREMLTRPDGGLRLFLDPGGPLVKTFLDGDTSHPELKGPATLLIGPEGGWTDEEREEAQRAGYRAVGLGPGVLRAETAAIAALSVLMHWAAEAGG